MFAFSTATTICAVSTGLPEATATAASRLWSCISFTSESARESVSPNPVSPVADGAVDDDAGGLGAGQHRVEPARVVGPQRDGLALVRPTRRGHGRVAVRDVFRDDVHARTLGRQARRAHVESTKDVHGDPHTRPEMTC